MDMPNPKQLIAATSAKWRNPLDALMASPLGGLMKRLGIAPGKKRGEGLLDLAGALLSLRGRASGPALASTLMDLYEASSSADRLTFLGQLHDQFPHNAAAIDAAVTVWQHDRNESAALALHDAAKSPCAQLIDLLNLAPGGTRRLLAMRCDLLAAKNKTPGLRALDEAFEDAFTAWFNAGFLDLRRIGWDSSAALLERIIRYEAVHTIQGWDDLRRRVEPVDRRCYGFFHPQMTDDPLIFVEVALTDTVPDAIGKIIAEQRNTVQPRAAQCAIFYSISNCQDGLRGIPFGNYLIKRVVGLLKEELPQLKTFATLSPVPGFARWLATAAPEFAETPPPAAQLRALAAHYLVKARSAKGQVIDPVARFHLGNGARLEFVHADADLSPNGLAQSHGIMVNYVYDLAEIEANHFALAEVGTVAASKEIQALAATAIGKNIS